MTRTPFRGTNWWSTRKFIEYFHPRPLNISPKMYKCQIKTRRKNCPDNNLDSCTTDIKDYTRGCHHIKVTNALIEMISVPQKEFYWAYAILT